MIEGVHMAEKKFTVAMDVENIGPHYGVNKLTFSEAVDSNKTIFYATNGTGKSFISRAFRLCTPFKAGLDNVQSFSHIFLRLARSSSPLPEIRPSWEAFAHPRSGCLLWFLVTKNSVHS